MSLIGASAEADLAARHLLEPGDHAQRRRLAAAGRADEDHELAILDLDVEVVDGERPVGVALADVIEDDVGHQAASLP